MQIRRASKEPADKIDEQPIGYFPTGNVMLNLALTERYNGGLGMGKITNIIGDSFVGKTMQVKSVFAEMAYDAKFDDYLLVDDDTEHGTGIDIERMFGIKTANRLIAPYYDKEKTPHYSDTVEDFVSSIWKRLKDDKPFLYALDTYDGLTDKEEQKRTEENVKIRDKNREKEEGSKETKEKGSYGQEKNREFNSTLRLVKSKLENSKSGLIIVSQVRENIGAGLFDPKLRRNGGKALKHYSWHEIWLIKIETIKRGAEGRERPVGAWVRASITKNRSTGKIRNVEFPIYYDYGVDNIEACIDFLVTENFWKKGKQGHIESEALGIEGSWPAKSGTTSRMELVKLIEDNNLERKLYREAERAWLEIEESLRIDRKRKYE